jgi:hypothetical protein
MKKTSACSMCISCFSVVPFAVGRSIVLATCSQMLRIKNKAT